MKIFGDGRRRTIVVDRSFQYRATIVGLVYIVAVAVVISLPLMSMMRSTDLLLQGRSQELISLYRNQQTHTILALSVFFAGLVVAWTLFTLWRTHKVAGPIVKMTRHIHRMASAVWPPI